MSDKAAVKRKIEPAEAGKLQRFVVTDGAVAITWSPRRAIAIHTAERRGDHYLGPDDCDVLPSGKCWGDCGCMAGDELTKAFEVEGDDVVWPVLERFTVNLQADSHDWVTVVLTCTAGQGPHKPPHDTWAVRNLSYCLNEDGEWEWEPTPSSRDDAFLARTRWPREEALARARASLRDLGEK